MKFYWTKHSNSRKRTPRHIENGSIVKIKSQFFEVLGWSEDCFDQNFKSVRFTRNFSKNSNNSKYHICDKPLFKGNIIWIPQTLINDYRPFSIKVVKINAEDYGKLVLSFQNACFNRLGFLTHDTAV